MLNATSPKKSGIWSEAAPNQNNDMLLTNVEVQSGIAHGLGFPLCGESVHAFFVLDTTDKYGIHAESWTVGGDETLKHHTIRNDLYA